MRTFVLAASLAALSLAAPAGAQDKKEPDLFARLKAIKGLNGPFTLVVHLQVKKGEEQTLLDAAKPCIAATLKEKGCLAYELSQDLETPTRFVLYERWSSPKALEDHFGQEHTKKLLGTLGRIADGAPKFIIGKKAGDK